jgi:hypothetical protein
MTREIEIEFPSVADRNEFEAAAKAHRMTPSEFMFFLFDTFQNARAGYKPLALVSAATMPPRRSRSGKAA